MAAGVLAAAVAVAAFGVEYQPAQDSDVSHPRPPLPPPAYLRYCHHIIPIEHQIVFSSWGFEGGGWGFGKVARARAACTKGVRVRQCASPESLSGEAACIATILHSGRWTGGFGVISPCLPSVLHVWQEFASRTEGSLALTAAAGPVIHLADESQKD